MKTEYLETETEGEGIAIINNDGKLTSFKVTSEVGYYIHEGEPEHGLDPYYEANVEVSQVRLMSEDEDIATIPIFKGTSYHRLVSQIVYSHFDLIALDMNVDSDEEREWDDIGEADSNHLKIEP